MKIAIPYDFPYPADIRREGIGVYVRFLVRSLLDNVSSLQIEIWTYHFNIDNVKLLFEDSFQKYPDRIFIYSDISKSEFFSWGNVSYWLDKILGFSKLISRGKRLFFNPQKLIKRNIRFQSQADVVFMFFATMKMGVWFQCPKFVQVHDLFTFPLEELFALHHGRDPVRDSNKIIANILEQYAEKNAIFVSSSEYIAKEHSLKFIPKIRPHQVAVIPFPPCIKKLSCSVISTVQEFKEKYQIPERYLFLPSQNRPNKNWGVVLQAISRLRKEGILLYFVTTGSVKDLKSDELLVKKLGIQDLIIETGNLCFDDLYLFYKYASLVVAPTIIEGMGIAGQALEALYVGVPVIHARSLGIDESLQSVGLTQQTADLNWFDCSDFETLVVKIKEVLSDPASHIKKQKHILKAYSRRTWKDVARDYMSIFQGQIKE